MNYTGMQMKLNNDIQSAGALEGGRRLVVHHSDLNTTVPHGSKVAIDPCSFFKLRAGDMVVVRTSEGIALRRFVRSKISPAETRLVMATETGTQEMSVKSLMGRVREVEHKGQKFDPNPTSWLAILANRLTACGTRFGRAAA
ncbi:MAG: hypothetical protein AB7S38_33765 [Vulcanimicrobiota bacterium]